MTLRCLYSTPKLPLDLEEANLGNKAMTLPGKNMFPRMEWTHHCGLDASPEGTAPPVASA